MPTYRITAPDGKVYKVTAPEGATMEQVRARVMQQAAPAASQAAPMTPEEKLANEDRLTGTSLDPMSGRSDLSNVAAGAGKSLRDTGLGLTQFAAQGGVVGPLATSGLEALGIDLPENPILNWANERINANREADTRLLDTKAGLGGNIAGTVAQVVAPAGALAGAARVPQLARQAPAITTAVRALAPTSVKAGAAQGAVLGGLQPVEEGGSRALNTALGTAGGFVGGVLPRVLGAGVRAGSRLVEPFYEKGMERIAGRTLQRFARDPALTNQLSDPILGDAPTLAEATLDPGIAQLQRAAATKSPEVASAIFDARVLANDRRAQALQGFAGTPAQREALIAGIGKAEDAAYNAIRQDTGVNVRPVVQRIDDILAGPNGKRAAVRSALNNIREALFLDADQAVPEQSVDRLLGARMVIKDLLEGGGENNAGRLAQSQLIEVRGLLDNAIRKVSPRLDEALDARRVGMRPVNEMDTMTDLLQRSTIPVPTASGGMARGLQPSAFLRPTEDLDALARRGTGFRKAEADDVLSPQAQEAIEGVRIGLARQQFADNAAKAPGSPTAQFLAGQNIMDAMGASNSYTSGVMNMIGAALDKPYAFVGVPERLNTLMARVLTNPAEARRILTALPPRDRMLIEKAIGRLSAPAGVGAAQE